MAGLTPISEALAMQIDPKSTDIALMDTRTGAIERFRAFGQPRINAIRIPATDIEQPDKFGGDAFLAYGTRRRVSRSGGRKSQ
jgi:hypothetical protein